MNDLIRYCPICNKELKYSSKYSVIYAEQRNSKCNSCSSKGRPCWNGGITMTEDFCKKVSDGTKNKYKEGWSPRLGKYHTEEAKNKMAISHTGKTITEEHKQKLSLLNTGEKNRFYGKHHTEEMKLKRRQQIMKRLEKLGIPNNEDKGARQFFEKYNSENKTNFVSMRFFEIGYYADGYEENLHEWIEYDTPMHNRLKQKKKDLIRQENIINYFKSINKPLNKFIRVKVDKNGVVKEVIQIL